MKRLILLTSILLVFSLTAVGQSVTVKEVISSASDPSSCIVGKLYINTTSPGKVWARVGGSCVRVDGLAGGAVGANPTASIGLTAVNGSATTFMRSDAAPALNQAIAPTWSARHIFSVNGAQDAPAILVSGEWHGAGIPSESEPLLLVQVAGHTSNNWSPSGTGFGVNASAGDNGNLIDLQTGGFRRFRVSTSAGEVLISDGTTSALVTLLANGTGSLRLADNAGTSFGRLQFGGTTSSFPSIKRNGTALNIRLADDSADAPLTSSTFQATANSAASAPAVNLAGTWFSGGTSTTTKPHLLIEPSGAISTAWDTGGTAFGVNSAGGFSGVLADFQNNGVTRLRILAGGSIAAAGNGNIGFSARAFIDSPGSGILTLNDPSFTNFNRLQFGGQSSSYPSLKRNSTAINVRLADDSADAPITASTGGFSGNVTLSGASSPTLAADANTVLVLNQSHASGSGIQFMTRNANRWQIAGAGHLTANTDNSFDIGNGSNADPRNVYAATSLSSRGTVVVGTTLTLPDNVRQTFNPGSTNAGLNVGDQAGNPSSPSNGDIWNNSTTNTMMMRQNGVSVGVRPYKVWIALVTQSGTSAPTATVLENTLGGTVTFARTGVGSYTFTLTSAFPNNKTTVLYGGCGSSQCFINSSRTSDNAVLVLTQDINLSQSDDILNISTFEIRVYP